MSELRGMVNPPEWFTRPLIELAAAVAWNTATRRGITRLSLAPDFGLLLGITPGTSMNIHTPAGPVEVYCDSHAPIHDGVRPEQHTEKCQPCGDVWLCVETCPVRVGVERSLMHARQAYAAREAERAALLVPPDEVLIVPPDEVLDALERLVWAWPELASSYADPPRIRALRAAKAILCKAGRPLPC